VREQNAQRSVEYGLGGQVLWELTSDQGLLYLHQDALGSTVALTKPDGSLAGTRAYDPFGAPRGSTTFPGSIWYAGEQYDAETALIYLRARYYDPQTGRFLSPDPTAGDPRDTQSLNVYAYARNNPLRYSDPSGQILDELVSGVGELAVFGLERLGASVRLTDALKGAFKGLSIAKSIVEIHRAEEENNALMRSFAARLPEYQTDQDIRDLALLSSYNLTKAYAKGFLGLIDADGIPILNAGMGIDIGERVGQGIIDLIGLGHSAPPTYSCHPIGTSTCLPGIYDSLKTSSPNNAGSTATSNVLPDRSAGRLPSQGTRRGNESLPGLPRTTGGAYVPVGNPPNKPTNVAPYNWYVTVDSAPNLQWSDNGSPDGHPIIASKVFVYRPGSSDLFFESDWLPISQYGHQYHPVGIPYATVSWNVQVMDDRGLVSDHSDIWNFTIYTPTVTIDPNSIQFVNEADGSIPASANELIGIKACATGNAA
jgi:RHS repeat-associated protein